MLGYKSKVLKVHRAICLDDLVPLNNVYRELEVKLDLAFVRDLVRDYYTSRMGRPSIDPVVFFKFQLIMFFEGIRSERQLMVMVNMRLDHRWYLGYDLDEAVPDHSSLSKIREQYGLDIFQRFFEAIVERCRQVGLVWGKELYFDSTQVRANADVDKQVPRFYFEAQTHLRALFAEGSPRTPEPTVRSRGLVDRYHGQRLVGSRTYTTQERKSDAYVCPTDPDATPLHSQPGHSRLGYHVHYVVDGGRARIILAVLVTPASIMDNTPMLDLERWSRFRWRLQPHIAVGDTKYGTLANIVGLEQDGIRAYLAVPDPSVRTKLYSQERFQYDAERDGYTCPQGQFLSLSSFDRLQQAFMYRTSPKICNACPLKTECTTSRYGRIVRRSVAQEYLDRVRSYRATPAYHKALRKRSVWIEPLFGEAKQWHQLAQFRLRRLEKVNIQALLIATGQNIKRLLSRKERPQSLKPAVSRVLDVPTTSVDAVSRCFLSFRSRISLPPACCFAISKDVS